MNVARWGLLLKRCVDDSASVREPASAASGAVGLWASGFGGPLPALWYGPVGRWGGLASPWTRKRSLQWAPRHVAIILDGNRRYAAKLNLERTQGHQVPFTAVPALPC